MKQETEESHQIEMQYSVLLSTVRNLIEISTLEKQKKTQYLQSLKRVDLKILRHLFLHATQPLSVSNMHYIICFLIAMSVSDISILFNIETASVYTNRYRIKKKFPQNYIFGF